jgi:hypothetical protein
MKQSLHLPYYFRVESVETHSNVPHIRQMITALAAHHSHLRSSQTQGQNGFWSYCCNGAAGAGTTGYCCARRALSLRAQRRRRTQTSSAPCPPRRDADDVQVRGARSAADGPGGDAGAVASAGDDLHKTFRSTLEPGVQPFLDSVRQLYASFGDIVARAFPVPPATRQEPPGYIRPWTHNFMVIRVCPLIVMFCSSCIRRTWRRTSRSFCH